MRYTLTDTVFHSTVEQFDAEGHRDDKESRHLDALKVVAAWGYTEYPTEYVLEDEDGEQVDLVDPYRSPNWQGAMERDLEALEARVVAHLTGKYTVFWTNSGYLSDEVFDTLTAAVDYGKSKGFEFCVCQDGNRVASWTTFGGLRTY